jgi:hypothetical protein
MAADVRIGNSISRNALASGFDLRDYSCGNRMLAHGG